MCVLCAFRDTQDPIAHLDQHIDSTITGISAPYTWDQIATQLTTGYWGTGKTYKFLLDPARTLTYNVTGLSSPEQAIAKAALEAWSEVTGITFVASTGSSQLVFDNNNSGAYAQFSTSGGFIVNSFINIQENWYPGLNLNNYNLQTYIHEIGHALGLGHAGNYNGSATFGVDNLYDNDSWLATVMSYFDQIDNTLVPGSFAWIASLMPADIIAIQNLYGFSGETNDGNSTYGVNSNIGGYLETLLNQWTGTISRTSDVYVGGPIAFTIYDSNGIDEINFSSFSQNQEISLIALTYSNVGGLIDNLTIARGVVVENATSGSGDDTLVGNEANNILIANAGNDSVSGNIGDDTLVAGSGTDSLYGGEGEDFLLGGIGGDVLDGGSGIDLVQYDEASQGVIADLQTPGSNAGEATADTYIAVENLFGSQHDDILRGDALVNALFGWLGSDTLQGRDGDDALFGGDGDDFLIGGTGSDVLDGGSGVDLVQYDDAASGLVADLQFSFANTGEAEGDTYIGVENLFGSLHDDVLRGDALANALLGWIGSDTLQGRDGDDSLFGGDGDDFLIGGTGSDVLDGGTGVDLVQYDDAQSGLVADLQFAAANTGDAAGDGYTAIENLFGSVHDDILRGDALANALFGWIGSDTLQGRDGSDALFGGDGDDFLIGGTGSDVLDGGTGVDLVQYDDAASAVTADLQTPSVNTGDAAGDSYLSIENLYGSNYSDNLRGNSGANALWGANGNDTLQGRDGMDTLSGGVGNDVLIGGTGGDLLDGGTGIDRADYSTASAGVVADLSAANLNTGEAAGDVYVSIENLNGSAHSDTLRGDAAANTLWGANGNDSLFGGSGSDTLYGGAGRDSIYGGAGDAIRDEFIFTTSSETTVGTNRDVVYDFVSGVDRLNFSSLDASTALAGNQAFAFAGVTASANAIWYTQIGADLLVRGDLNGDTTADFEVMIANITTLTTTDFLL